MSRTPAVYCMTVTRGSTWEDEFVYNDPLGVAINLTGYQARMQVRTLAGRFGTTTTASLVLTLATDGSTPYLFWETASQGRLVIRCPPTVHAVLNPTNQKRVSYAYAIEIYVPAGSTPEYVIPLVKGKVYVHGEITR